MKISLKLTYILLGSLSLLVTVLAWAPMSRVFADGPANASLTVYKDPSCGCCSQWVSHMEQAQFSVRPMNVPNLEPIKEQYGIAPAYRSCHTAVWNDGEYFFEGHIPAHLIKRFLAEKPRDAVGLTVPGMPVGSPGMEMPNRFTPYRVWLLKKDGNAEVYAEITDPAQQYDKQPSED